MQNIRNASWIVKLAFHAGVLILALVLMVVIRLALGISFPPQTVLAIAFLASIVSSLLTRRRETLDYLDPHSTRLRARYTARLIEDSRRQKR